MNGNTWPALRDKIAVQSRTWEGLHHSITWRHGEVAEVNPGYFIVRFSTGEVKWIGRNGDTQWRNLPEKRK